MLSKQRRARLHMISQTTTRCRLVQWYTVPVYVSLWQSTIETINKYSFELIKNQLLDSYKLLLTPWHWVNTSVATALLVCAAAVASFNAFAAFAISGTCSSGLAIDAACALDWSASHDTLCRFSRTTRIDVTKYIHGMIDIISSIGILTARYNVFRHKCGRGCHSRWFSRRSDQWHTCHMHHTWLSLLNRCTHLMINKGCLIYK